MDREGCARYITETYAAEPEHLWARYPAYAVFRHAGDRKWFAAIMDAPRRSLGLPGDGKLDILNVKCDPMLIGSFREGPGIYPGYHMDKSSWLSVALDGSADDGQIEALLEMSFALTAPKARRRKRGSAAER